MKIKYFAFFLLGIFSSANSWAQAFNRYKYEFSIGFGGTNMMSDVCAPNDPNKIAWVNLFNSVGYMGNTGMLYKFSDRQSASVNLSLGKLHAEDPSGDTKYWDAGRKSNTFFTEFSGRYEFMVIKEKKKRTVYRMLGESYLKNINVPIYLFVGAGGLYNTGNFSQTFTTNNSISTIKYSNFSFVIPYGIGFKTRISNTSFINLEVGLRFAFSDKIDNVKQGSTAWYGNDQYQFITVNYIFLLKSNKNGYPMFRTMFF